MTCDNGGAPCVYDGTLSLAICKPKIRLSAHKGDWILGIGGKMLDNRLIYMAKITDIIEYGAYYRDPAYKGRPDRIYQFDDMNHLIIRSDAQYHRDDFTRPRDIGNSDGTGLYPQARVLISTDFRYLGSGGTSSILIPYHSLSAMVKGLRQGHRVNHKPETLRDIQVLQLNLWEDDGYRKPGVPSEPPEFL